MQTFFFHTKKYAQELNNMTAAFSLCPSFCHALGPNEKEKTERTRFLILLLACLLLQVAYINPLSASPTKWSNTLKQFVGEQPTNCLSVFDYFVGSALKGLTVIQQFYKPKLFEVVLWTMGDWKKGACRLFLYTWWQRTYLTQGLNNIVKQYVHIRNSMVASNLKNRKSQKMEKLGNLRDILKINLTSERSRRKFLKVNVALCFSFSLKVVLPSFC